MFRLHEVGAGQVFTEGFPEMAEMYEKKGWLARQNGKGGVKKGVGQERIL